MGNILFNSDVLDEFNNDLLKHMNKKNTTYNYTQATMNKNYIKNKKNYKICLWLKKESMTSGFAELVNNIDFTKINVLLDIGAGTGELIDYIHENNIKHSIKKIINIDVNINALNIYKDKIARYPEIEFIFYNNNIIEINDEIINKINEHNIDLVISMGVFQCIDLKDIKKFINYLLRFGNTDSQHFITALRYDNKRKRNIYLNAYKEEEIAYIFTEFGSIPLKQGIYSSFVDKPILNSDYDFLYYMGKK